MAIWGGGGDDDDRGEFAVDDGDQDESWFGVWLRAKMKGYLASAASPDVP
ncbi:MAG: hypothetical protein ACREFD_04310 [Stellaceae bacterium]